MLEGSADGEGLEFTRAGGEMLIMHTIFPFCLAVVLVIFTPLQVFLGGVDHAGAIFFCTLSPG